MENFHPKCDSTVMVQDGWMWMCSVPRLEGPGALRWTKVVSFLAPISEPAAVFVSGDHILILSTAI